jgi:hypothetical protein
MADLSFAVLDAHAESHAAAPTLKFKLRVSDAAATPVHAILLRCQIQIDTRRRRHAPAEQERLADLFGEPERWRDTLKPLVWSSVSVNVPGFEGSVEVDVPVACTYDFEVSAARYLNTLDGGDVPLLFLFSGTMFIRSQNGFQVQQIPWDKEAAFRMPVQVWRDLMDLYFPGSAWIRLRRENVDALERFRARNQMMSMDEAIEALMAAAEAPVR